MKKFAMLALAMSLFLVACGEKKEEEKPAEQPAAEATATTTEAAATTTEAAAEAKSFSVKTEDGKEFTLEVAADGATATLTDAEGKVTELKNAETASGERYADEAGNEIAMKGTEGVLTLGDLKEVPVTVEAKQLEKIFKLKQEEIPAFFLIPVNEGAEIALNTAKKFIDENPNSFDLILWVLDEKTYVVYKEKYEKIIKE